MKRITVVIDDNVHAQFKAKCALDRLTATDVVTQLVADYVAGRVKVKPPKANGKVKRA